MIYRILADAVVFIHFLWIIFLITGSLWGRKNKAVRYIHISGLFFALFIHVLDWYCPLTHIEVWLRSLHNPALAYRGSFIIHYVERIIYLDASPLLITVLTITLCAFHGWIYTGALRRRRL
ncbi:MAG: DUF2784 domain-containing protein, partial [Nitrospirales bacterium]|nr:DUF2784 domain-containing protein [Nitrospirales bacterium]